MTWDRERENTIKEVFMNRGIELIYIIGLSDFSEVPNYLIVKSLSEHLPYWCN